MIPDSETKMQLTAINETKQHELTAQRDVANMFTSPVQMNIQNNTAQKDRRPQTLKERLALRKL